MPMRRALSLAFVFMLAAISESFAAEEMSKCAPGDIVLWGDGSHDDTAALNAWLSGKTVVWAKTAEPVGSTIADRAFRLAEAIYVRAGTDRTLLRFRFLWPERGEIVSADSISTGNDPDQQPIAVNLNIVGGDSDEGKPFDAPNLAPLDLGDRTHCLTS